MAEKKLKKLPHITGVVPRFYDREVIYNMAIIINALSDTVNFLNEKVIALEEKLEGKTMAEKEYIERGALAEEIASLSVTVTGLRCGKGYLKEIVEHYKNSVEKIIDDQPIADVVEVVRCKDCVHRDPEDRKCEHHMSNNIFARQDNDYCSYGERKEQQ